MDQELKQQLEWMNENLNAIIANQTTIYLLLKEMEELLGSKKLEE